MKKLVVIQNLKAQVTRSFLRVFAGFMVAVLLTSGCQRSDKSNTSNGEDESVEQVDTSQVSASDVYAERVSVLTGALGMTESELIGYSITCGVDLSDVTIPWDYVRQVVLPVLTAEQLNRQLIDVMNQVETPRCFYAQNRD